jgi:hypothetical protein
MGAWQSETGNIFNDPDSSSIVCDLLCISEKPGILNMHWNMPAKIDCHQAFVQQ